MSEAENQMKRMVLLACLTIVAALLIWIGFIMAVTYIRAPRMVAELEDSGALPFSPSELPRSRICALLIGDGGSLNILAQSPRMLRGI
jgi:hypothetical protein